MATTFFTADTHFAKETAIFQDHRPFRDVDEMDSALISNWNSVVGDDDDAYVLGDFIDTENFDKACSVLQQLNGHIHLISGNHDNNIIEWMSDEAKRNALSKKIVEITPYKEIALKDSKGEEQLAILFHYPIHSYNKSSHILTDGRRTIMLYGHVHYGHEFWELRNTMFDRDMPWRGVNVGTMVWNYRPISLDEIEQVLDQPDDCHVSHSTLCRCAYFKGTQKCQGCIYGWYHHANIMEQSIDDVLKKHDELVTNGKDEPIDDTCFVYCGKKK